MSQNASCFLRLARQVGLNGNVKKGGPRVAFNPQQKAVDAVVRAAKKRRDLIDIARRAEIAPESLDFAEIKSIAAFVLDHQDCLLEIA